MIFFISIYFFFILIIRSGISKKSPIKLITISWNFMISQAKREIKLTHYITINFYCTNFYSLFVLVKCPQSKNSITAFVQIIAGITLRGSHQDNIICWMLSPSIQFFSFLSFLNKSLTIPSLLLSQQITFLMFCSISFFLFLVSLENWPSFPWAALRQKGTIRKRMWKCFHVRNIDCDQLFLLYPLVFSPHSFFLLCCHF